MFRRILALSIAIMLMPAGLAWSESADHPVLSELQTGSAGDAKQEFIEIYNPNSDQVNLEGWLLEYKSASSEDNWIKKATLTGNIPGHGFILLATAGYLAPDVIMTAGLSGTAGHVRLRSDLGETIDLLAWGEAANQPDAAPAAAPSAGHSLERLPGNRVEDGGNAFDTDDNSADFIIRDIPEPQSSSSASEIPYTGELPEAVIAESEPAAQSSTIWPGVRITELLPDPAAPQQDSTDEFIEIFNPGPATIELTGYTLQSGSGFKYSFDLSGTSILPGGYLPLYSADTNLSLTNTGGAARILAPDGSVISQTAPYPKAKPGNSWSEHGPNWEWSTTPTPGQVNRIVAPPVKAAAAKKTTAKKSTSKASAAKAGKAKAKSAAQVAGTQAGSDNLSVTSPKWLIITLASLTIGYAIYELRYDFRNFYQLARKYARRGRKAGPPVKGR